MGYEVDIETTFKGAPNNKSIKFKSRGVDYLKYNKNSKVLLFLMYWPPETRKELIPILWYPNQSRRREAYIKIMMRDIIR